MARNVEIQFERYTGSGSGANRNNSQSRKLDVDSSAQEALPPKSVPKSGYLLWKVNMTNICHVNISICKSHKGTIACEVIDMNACHTLLGRPWQYDADTRGERTHIPSLRLLVSLINLEFCSLLNVRMEYVLLLNKEVKKHPF